MISHQCLALHLSLENFSLGEYFQEFQALHNSSEWTEEISIRRVLFQNGFYISSLKPLLAHFHDSV